MNRLLLVFLLLLLPSFAHAAQPYPARVISVQDGDSITVLTSDNRQVKIRLYGIDCPERKQAFGNRARQATASAVHGKTVNVQPVEKDRYGRTVAIVTQPDGEMLNAWLVKEGMAWVYPQYCKRADICNRLKELEADARAAKIGLWTEEAAPPWVWRRAENQEGMICGG